MTIGDFVGLFTALATLATVGLLWRQIRQTGKITKAQVLLDLHGKFHEFDDLHKTLYAREPIDLPNETSVNWLRVFDYLSLFERVQIMLDEKVIPLEQVDFLYLYRLDAILSNQDIFTRLQAEPDRWLNFIRLCKSIAARETRKLAQYRNDSFISVCEQLQVVDPISPDSWRDAG